uniref:Uncharacterized protein n=1 Tax=Anguilla anguilla TaxID=7936 RepID=A0A0E9V2C4_ANGAN
MMYDLINNKKLVEINLTFLTVSPGLTFTTFYSYIEI